MGSGLNTGGHPLPQPGVGTDLPLSREALGGGGGGTRRGREEEGEGWEESVKLLSRSYRARPSGQDWA